MLLFFDIDGTLIDDDTHQIPESTREALWKAHERHHLLFINTGRTPCNLDPRLDSLPLDGLILGCGTEIILRGQTLHSFSFSHAQSMQILQYFRKFQLPMFFEGREKISLDPLLPFTSALTSIHTYAEKTGILGSATDPDFSFVKFFTFCEDPETVRLLESAPDASFQCIDRGGSEHGWEGVPRGYSKAAGIDRVLDALGESLDDCIAFGDSSNDLSMLLHVPCSVCMGQADESVQKQCSMVTSRPNEDGIYQAMEKLGSI